MPVRLRPVYDPEDLFRYGLLLTWKNEEGPASLGELRKRVEGLGRKGKVLQASKPYFGFYMGYLTRVSVPRVMVPREAAMSAGFAPFILLMKQAAQAPDVVSMFAWGTAVEDAARPAVGGVLRPLMRLVRSYWYSNASEGELVVVANGSRVEVDEHLDPSALTPRTAVLVAYARPGFAMAMLSFSLSWYQQYLAELSMRASPVAIRASSLAEAAPQLLGDLQQAQAQGQGQQQEQQGRRRRWLF